MSDTHSAGARPLAGASYQEITADYRDDLERVEEAIRKNFQSDVAMIPAVSGYLVRGGGKRIRPLLVIVSSRLCGLSGSPRSITMSVVAEYIHAATLLHDDVVDGADTRRGADSANVKFGNEASVLVGDFLFAKSFQLMSADSDIRVVQAISRATKSLAEGEVLQLSNTLNLRITEEEYLDTIYRKTGALMEACARVGAILGGAGREVEEALGKYGRNIGIAFQMVDDALDWTGDAKTWGKPLGADLAEGKITLPVIRALEAADGAERDTIRRIVERAGGDGFEAALEILKRHGALSQTMELARAYVEEAKLSLSCFDPLNRDAAALRAIADYIVDRSV
ncbi:MAG: polyprenyl synthetase family protein [Candidatus Nitrospinota bacterium M3_3B_026]